MRWQELFDDLEGQLRAEEQRDLLAEVADRTRRERALVGLQERLLAAVGGNPLEVRLAGLGSVRGQVTAVGADWFLVEDAVGRPERLERSVLLTFTAVRSLAGLGRRATVAGAVARAFGLGAALRALSRDRAVVEVADLEGTTTSGTIDRVGRDLVDVAEHAIDLPRRPQYVGAVRSVPFHAIAGVRRRS